MGIIFQHVAPKAERGILAPEEEEGHDVPSRAHVPTSPWHKSSGIPTSATEGGHGEHGRVPLAAALPNDPEDLSGFTKAMAESTNAKYLRQMEADGVHQLDEDADGEGRESSFSSSF
jgi:hypothetical protein